MRTLSGDLGPFYTDNRFTGVGRRNARCFEDNTANQFIAIGQERTSAAMSFEHTFSESAEFYSFFTYSDLETVREWDGISFSRTNHLVQSEPAGRVIHLSWQPYVAAPAANNPNLISNGGFGEGYYGGGVKLAGLVQPKIS